ncbi:MAG: TetR/AcrR family transcriptional regulator [Pseudomonadota bacterium]
MADMAIDNDIVNIVNNIFYFYVMDSDTPPRLHIRMRAAKPARSRRPTLKDKKREETRAKLIASAKELFGAYGYDDVTVTEIAQQAGVTHAMINVYFGGKPGLLYEIIKENNEPQYQDSLRIAESDSPPMDKISSILLLWARFDAKDPSLLAIMQSYAWIWPEETEVENAADRARFKELIATLLQEAKRADLIAMELDPRAASNAIFAIYTWALRSAVFEDASPEDCHTQIMDQVKAIVA